MRILAAILALQFATVVQISAQTTPTADRPRGQGYAFAGPGWGNTGPGDGNIQFGIGGEQFIYKGLSFGAEIGGVAPWPTSRPNSGFSAWVVGLGSADLSLHVLPHDSNRGISPFLTGGYSLFFRAGTFSGYNVGGGVNVWLKRKTALRFEFRHQESYRHRDSSNFRVGLSFR